MKMILPVGQLEVALNAYNCAVGAARRQVQMAGVL